MKKCSYCGAEYPDDVTVCVIDQTPFNKTHFVGEPPSRMNIPVKRGILLMVYLLWCFVVGVYVAKLYVDRWNAMSAAYPTWAGYTLRATVFLRLPSLVAIYLWSRSGVVGYVLLSAIEMAVGVALGFQQDLLGIIGVILLVALVWPKWQFMSWGISSCPKMPVSEIL
jgi:hypothetical protein